MVYCRLMSYGFKFSANRLGGHKKLWDTGVYGLSEAWVMRVSTVPRSHLTTATATGTTLIRDIELGNLDTITCNFSVGTR